MPAQAQNMAPGVPAHASTGGGRGVGTGGARLPGGPAGGSHHPGCTAGQPLCSPRSRQGRVSPNPVELRAWSLACPATPRDSPRRTARPTPPRPPPLQVMAPDPPPSQALRLWPPLSWLPRSPKPPPEAPPPPPPPPPRRPWHHPGYTGGRPCRSREAPGPPRRDKLTPSRTGAPTL